jgi:hypothetical protein
MMTMKAVATALAAAIGAMRILLPHGVCKRKRIYQVYLRTKKKMGTAEAKEFLNFL